MIPRVSVCLTDTDGNVTEFTLDRKTILVPQAIADAPKVDGAIRSLRIWQEWMSTFIKNGLERDAFGKVVEDKREAFLKEQEQYELEKNKS